MTSHRSVNLTPAAPERPGKYSSDIELCNSLEACLVQLEGWVAWKCPAQHKAEHRAEIAKHYAVLKRARGQA